MTARIFKIVFLLCCISLAAISHADEQAIPAVSQKPLQAMQRLAPLAGEWDMTMFVTPDDGETWNATPPQAVSVDFGHKGFMLGEQPAMLDGPGFHMHSWLSYDQYREVCRKADLDDVWGIFDLYEGTIDDDRLILTNLASPTFVPLEDGRWRGFRLILELKAGNRWMWIDKTDDGGETWQPAFKVEYQRRS